MKSRFWTRVLYVLAALIVLGRIGNALYGTDGFWAGMIKLSLPVSTQLIGADVESLGEDVILFLAIRDIVLRIRSTQILVRASSIAYPFRQTFRRLELERRWWHRLCVVIFNVVLAGAAALTALLVYGTLAPSLGTMPEISVFSPNPSYAGGPKAAESMKSIEMPDGSFPDFPMSVSDEAIKAQWQHEESQLTTRAVLFSMAITVLVTICFSYLLQFSYRALLYVVFGNSDRSIASGV